MSVIFKIIDSFNSLEEKVKNLESKIDSLEENLLQKDRAISGLSLKITNGYPMSNSQFSNSLDYVDLSPEQAFQFYQDDKVFYLIDVCPHDHKASLDLTEAKKIPLDELAYRQNEFPNKNIPVLVISENGTKSILACKQLARLGYLCCYNISGGYEYWPEQTTSSSKLNLAA